MPVSATAATIVRVPNCDCRVEGPRHQLIALDAHMDMASTLFTFTFTQLTHMDASNYNLLLHRNLYSYHGIRPSPSSCC